MADIIPFHGDPERTRDQQSGVTNREIIMFPGTNIRVLRRQLGLPEYGLIVAGPDGRALGARADDPPAE